MAARQRKPVDTETYEGRFATRLRMLREKAKLTVEQAASELGIVPTAIYGWESAYHQPKVADFPKIAATYKVKKAKDILPNE